MPYRAWNRTKSPAIYDWEQDKKPSQDWLGTGEGIDEQSMTARTGRKGSVAGIELDGIVDIAAGDRDLDGGVIVAIDDRVGCVVLVRADKAVAIEEEDGAGYSGLEFSLSFAEG